MTYRILTETQPGVFSPTGDTFDGSADEVHAHLIALQEQHGVCFAAEAIAA